MTQKAINLGNSLANAYTNAPRGEQVTRIHLFAIQYAEEIKEEGIKDVIKASRIPLSYHVEVNKGIKLAAYVVAKPNAPIL